MGMDKNPYQLMRDQAVNKPALYIAMELREGECPHGLPFRVIVAEKIGPYEPGAACRPFSSARG